MTVHLTPHSGEWVFPCCELDTLEIGRDDTVTEDPDLVTCEGRDLGLCAYYARANGFPGHDPEAICSMGCTDEPQCQTCEPNGGWPSHPRTSTGAFQ